MPRPRKPLELARLTGAMAKDPQRYRNRHEPVDDRPLGEPYEWLPEDAKAAWKEMVPNLPWLRCCHRGIVGITAILAGKMMKDALGLPGMKLLNSCLGALGATPASFPKVGWSPPADDDDDPAAKYFR